jgi:hypothetical protein
MECAAAVTADNATLSVLARLRQLDSLSLCVGRATAHGLAFLSALTGLTRLWLTHSRVADDGLQARILNEMMILFLVVK